MFVPTKEQEDSSPDGAFKAYRKNGAVAEYLSNDFSFFLGLPSFDSLELRGGYVFRYGFAVPNREALVAIKKAVASSGGLPTLEMGAGLAYWAHLLKGHGVAVQCYDNHDPAWEWTRDPWVTVNTGSVEVITDPCNILLIWPPYNEPFAADVFKAWLKVATATSVFIYVGEGSGGCTGDSEFFKLLNQHAEEVDTVDIPTWDGVEDSMTIYKKKP